MTTMQVDDIDNALIRCTAATLRRFPEQVWETPLLQNMQHILAANGGPNVNSLSLKLENLQSTGSFKVRGVVNQFANLKAEDRQARRQLVTMSAGNYGRAFSMVAQLNDMPATVFVPDAAPKERTDVMRGFGAEVISVPKSELSASVEEHVQNHNSLYFHSFDDPILIAGQATVACELSDTLAAPADIVLSCCGGGGLLAGTSVALRAFGWEDTRIYGVESEMCADMHRAFENRKGNSDALNLQNDECCTSENCNCQIGKFTICSGLAPPYVGKHCQELVVRHVNDILLVTDDEVKRAMRVLFEIGLVVEPSGAAGFAALLSGKVPDTDGRNVVVIISGGNVSLADFAKYCAEY